MFTLPFISFYVSYFLFQEKAHPENYAGGVAILVTNLIIAGYCYSAFTEEDQEGPKRGIRKERTD
jgi:hypothetical protein